MGKGIALAKKFADVGMGWCSQPPARKIAPPPPVCRLYFRELARARFVGALALLSSSVI
jgi:hypothetical protein